MGLVRFRRWRMLCRVVSGHGVWEGVGVGLVWFLGCFVQCMLVLFSGLGSVLVGFWWSVFGVL